MSTVSFLFDEWNTDCKQTLDGVGYKGNTHTARNGKECQSWADALKSILKYSGLTDASFPDGSAENAKNYCRNPQSSTRGYVKDAWCVAKDDGAAYFCDLPLCCEATLQTFKPIAQGRI